MPQHRTQNAANIAADFLTRCFAPGESIALLLRRENPAGILQRIVALERAVAPRHLGWLARENSASANIYVAANPLCSGSRKCTKDCIATVRHLYLDLDTDGEVRLASLRASDAVQPPHAILSTSLGKNQVLSCVDSFTFYQQESALKLLAVTFGGDLACTDCNRVLRLLGFLNCKCDPAYPITVEYPDDSTWNSNDFRMNILVAMPCFRPAQYHCESIAISPPIPVAIGHGFCMNLPRRKTLQSSCKSWLRAVPMSRIFSTTHSEPGMSHRPDFCSLKAFRQTTLSRCL
jgi:hypothetical protein